MSLKYTGLRDQSALADAPDKVQIEFARPVRWRGGIEAGACVLCGNRHRE